MPYLEAQIPYELTYIPLTPLGLARLRHGVMGRSRWRFTRRIVEVGVEVAWSSLLDWIYPLKPEVVRLRDGLLPQNSKSVAIFAHWSPTGRISDLVFHQLSIWLEAGFDIVFVSNTLPPQKDWDKLQHYVVLQIARKGGGRDFGAWSTAIRLTSNWIDQLDELLLLNDSMVGPIRPLPPILAALRSGGDGLFGMTEARGGGAHLQSYLLLARGQAPIKSLCEHVCSCSPTRSKWLLVQQGELRLTRYMLKQGHRVGALFGHDRVRREIDLQLLQKFGTRYKKDDAFDIYPLNPTHHLWDFLITRFGFPFIKTELLLRNPGNIDSVDRWRDLTPLEMVEKIEEHLNVMRRKDIKQIS